MTKTVLVTGGAGFVGSQVCKALAASGYLPVVYDNLRHGYDWAVQWGPLEVGDVRDRAAVTAAIRRHNPEAVLHFAGLIAVGESVADPQLHYDNNTVGSLALLQAMQDCDVRRIVFSSTAAVYGEPDTIPIPEDHPLRPESPYGASKRFVEQMLQDFSRAYGFGAAALRYFNAAGSDPDGDIGEAHEPETHLIPLALQAAAGDRAQMALFGNDYPTRDGTCIRDYIHVSDLADAHIRALDYITQQDAVFDAFNLGTKFGVSNAEVLNAVKTVTGRDFPIQIQDRRPGDPAILVADSDKARDVLGWRPQHTAIDVQVTDAWRWYQKHHHAKASA